MKYQLELNPKISIHVEANSLSEASLILATSGLNVRGRLVQEKPNQEIPKIKMFQKQRPYIRISVESEGLNYQNISIDGVDLQEAEKQIAAIFINYDGPNSGSTSRINIREGVGAKLGKQKSINVAGVTPKQAIEAIINYIGEQCQD